MKLPHSTISFRPLRLLVTLLGISGSAFAQTPVTGDLSVTGSVIMGTGDSNGGIELRLGGLIIGKGLYSGISCLSSSDQGAGTRMLWYPQKAAFRAGSVSGILWDDASIGRGSAAFGTNTKASGQFSFAAGLGNLALGDQSTAMGGGSLASGPCSLATGGGNSATGSHSSAMGNWTIAAGDTSTSLGFCTLASGWASLASGFFSTASGDFSTSMGVQTKADAVYAVAIGSLNLGGGDHELWIPEDPLFEIGNGNPEAYEITPSNALTVYKNGNMDVQGVVTCAPGGDIPMFTGN